jgi:hypothetical protein
MSGLESVGSKKTLALRLHPAHAALLKMKFNISLPAAVFVSLFATHARANPHDLPFNYPYETLGQGEGEIEMYTDMTPLRVNADPTHATPGRLWEPWYRLTTEIEYGASDRWELALYQVFEAAPQDGGSNSLGFDGLKWRARTRLAEQGEWPIDVGLYFELETMHDELAFEEKILLQKRYKNLRWLANLWVEQQIERPWDAKPYRSNVQFVVNPTTGLTYELTPTFHLGAEYWARGILGEGDTREGRLTHFAGPAFHLNFGKVWTSLGVYANLSDATTPQPGEFYGPVWLRAMVGIELDGGGGARPEAAPSNEEEAHAHPAVAPSISQLHHQRCGACHTRVEPGSRTREELEVALARHRDRVALSEEQWRNLVDYVAKQ